MNLRFVEAFYWVATLKSVSRAAEKLFITQSAMSARVAALEEELGALLLDRRDKTFRLTVAGSRFVVHAQKLLELQRAAKTEIGSNSALDLTIRIGAIESVLHSWLIPWIEVLRAEQPTLELELTVETTPVLVDQIRRGALDLAFAALPASGDGIRTKANHADVLCWQHQHSQKALLRHSGFRDARPADLSAWIATARRSARSLENGRSQTQESARDFLHLCDGAAGSGRLRCCHLAAGRCGPFERSIQHQSTVLFG